MIFWGTNIIKEPIMRIATNIKKFPALLLITFHLKEYSFKKVQGLCQKDEKLFIFRRIEALSGQRYLFVFNKLLFITAG